ncbi:MAG: hypothetical protein NTV03_00810, partial [Candidatus Nomurabacteria bacterium]|nr:hypothetical protein [Candidatus Nomurabacteria bacterium]
EECMTFSLAAGIVPDNKKEQMQKTLDVLKQGIKPPACRPNPPSQSEQSDGSGGPNEGQGFNSKNNSEPNQPDQSGQDLQPCDEYCADSSHVEECVKFSVAIGNMTQEQGQNSIKNGNKGPGGCIGKDACNTFCNNPDNQETCFNFAKDNGMISEEDLQKMQNGQGGGDGQGQINEQLQPWADMCQPDGNGNPTELACADDAGEFVTDAKIGADKQPVCPTGSTAKCGNYPQIHQQGQNQQNQNQQGKSGDQKQGGPGNGPGKGAGKGGPGNNGGGGGQSGWSNGTGNGGGNGGPDSTYKGGKNNGGPGGQGGGGQGQPNQPVQRLPQQQPGQPDQGVTNVGPCGTGPGTCSGIGPDDINGGDGPNQPGQQPGQMQIEQQQQEPQQQQQQ